LLAASSNAAAPNTPVDFVAAGDQSGAFAANQITFKGNAPGIQMPMGAQSGDASTPAGQVPLGTIQPDTNPSIQWSRSADNGLGLGVAGSIPQTNQAVGSTPAANASSDAGPARDA